MRCLTGPEVGREGLRDKALVHVHQGVSLFARLLHASRHYECRSKTERSGHLHKLIVNGDEVLVAVGVEARVFHQLLQSQRRLMPQLAAVSNPTPPNQKRTRTPSHKQSRTDTCRSLSFVSIDAPVTRRARLRRQCRLCRAKQDPAHARRQARGLQRPT